MTSTDYTRRIQRELDLLGISEHLIAHKRLPLQHEAIDLVVAETDAAGRSHLMTAEAAAAWWQLKRAASEDRVALEIVSAFRSIERQIDILRTKLAAGLPMATILTLSAPPGYSEHHTGRAIDINTPGCAPTEAPFEHTEAYRWLSEHAGRFGFTLSYPRDNAFGFIYEPWHWCYQVTQS